MEPPIITANSRGQITLPKSLRDRTGTRHYICHYVKGNLVLEPLQTREEFLAECEAAIKDYDEHGGYSLEEVCKMNKL